MLCGHARSTRGRRTISTLNLSVEVYPFAVPVRSPLPLAVTFAPQDNPTAESQVQQAAWRQTADYPINAWRQQRLAWARFSGGLLPDVRQPLRHAGLGTRLRGSERLHKRGRLGMFNLGYYGVLGPPRRTSTSGRGNARRDCGRHTTRPRSLGLLDHAYIYGCDEQPADRLPRVERAAADLKRSSPACLVMTTTYDHSYGTAR